jgi:hypothetical protein
MKFDFRDRLGEVAKMALVLVTLIALIIFGNSMIMVTSNKCDKDDTAGHQPAQCRLVAGISLPKTGGGSMEKGNPVNPGQSTYFTVPALAASYNLDDSRPETPVIETKSAPRFDLKHCLLSTTTAAISASKAREFTLVGAKPSGTS